MGLGEQRWADLGVPGPHGREVGGRQSQTDYCRDGEPEAGRGTGQPKPTAAAERSQGKRASSTARPGEAQQCLGLFPPRLGRGCTPGS